jgi:hypothetical protein
LLAIGDLFLHISLLGTALGTGTGFLKKALELGRWCLLPHPVLIITYINRWQWDVSLVGLAVFTFTEKAS